MRLVTNILLLFVCLVALSLAEDDEEAIKRSKGSYNEKKGLYRSKDGESGSSSSGKAGDKFAGMRSRGDNGENAAGAAGADEESSNVASAFKGRRGRKSRHRGGMVFKNAAARKRFNNYRKKQDRQTRKWLKRLKNNPNARPPKGMSEKEQQRHLDNISHLGGHSSDGERTALGSERDAKSRGVTGRGRGRKGRRRRMQARMKRCRQKFKYKKCKDLIFKSRRGGRNFMLSPNYKKSINNKEIGIITDESGKKYYYETECVKEKSKKKKKKRDCTNTPSKLTSDDGTMLQCKAEVIGDNTKNRCCNVRKNDCVETLSDNKDGSVSFSKGHTESGNSKCEQEDKPIRVREKGEVVSLKITKVHCGLDSSGALNSNAQDIETFGNSASCETYEKGGKSITISKPEYVADKKVSRQGTVTYDFPQCGTMSAYLNFEKFSTRERARIIPLLAYQFTVNVKPVGSLKCQDEMTCTVSQLQGKAKLQNKKHLKGNNCYYCRMCGQDLRENSGILKKSDLDVCDIRNPPKKVKISARICPVQKSKDAVCHTFGKTLNDKTGYYETGKDVYIKIAIFLRQQTKDMTDASYEKLKKSRLGWRLAKPGYRLTYMADDPLAAFLGNKDDKPSKEYQAYKGYHLTEDFRGTQITCSAFKAKYNLFGDDLTEFLDAVNTLQNAKGLLKGQKARCKRLERRWEKKYGGKSEGGGSFTDIFGG